MKTMNILTMLVSACLLTVTGCQDKGYTIPIGSDAVPSVPSYVKVEKNDSGIWTLFVDGEPYYVNGAATNRFYTDVRKFGGNTIRLYSASSKDTKQILDDAYQAGLKVYLGLGMAQARYFDYTNESKVAEQKENIKKYVTQFKNHPALLCWSVGNETEMSNENNQNLWKAIGDVVAMVKEMDPNHPVTNTLTSSSATKLKNLLNNAPGIDFISVNSYYPTVSGIAGNFESAGVDLPFMVTEFGPRGTWNMSSEGERILPWGDGFSETSHALVEETSTEKEEIYLKIWKEDIKANEAKGCLGSFIFVWGYQTHGEVLNWYATHTTDRYTYGCCDAIQYCWTGSYPSIRAPRIESRKDMTMNGLTAESAIKVAIGSANTAKVIATSASDITLRYHWFIFKEGDKATDGSMPEGIGNLIKEDGASEISFTAPSIPGGYRLYVFVYDDVNKKAASACIPFYAE